jgi:phage shock protein PspC (stress-responsive transcriptional regulator)
MNEVTRIHLGRQPFTISVDAHKSLRAYLDAIEKQAGDSADDVTKEVELRMAELLTERGVTSEKVILMDDVKFLKDQLGSPKDFKADDDSEEKESEEEPPVNKKLFRDTEHGMIAGVAAGVANYLGTEILLIRILFIFLTFLSGTGIVVYILLWLLVPEAKSSSDRLQMMGEAVTVENLKGIVDRADFPGAADRAKGKVAPVANGIFDIILKIVGVGFILAGLGALFGLIATKVYMILHNGMLFQENLFPVGSTETLLFNLGVVLAGIVSVFVLLIGLALFRRKWPIPTWASAVLLGLFFVGLAISAALAGDVAPKVRDRVHGIHHLKTISLQPFDSVNINGNGVSYRYIPSNTSYYAQIIYDGNADTSPIKAKVTNHKLNIDTTAFRGEKCDMLCLFPNNNLMIVVYSPTFPATNASPGVKSIQGPCFEDSCDYR